jgi:NadR type nicotinamide-nucleotide adenylyltransferase
LPSWVITPGRKKLFPQNPKQEKKSSQYLKKIAITGPESTGKSWLSTKLAAHYGSLFVPEYAREYLKKLDRPYTLDDVVMIAQGQLHLESIMTKLASGYLFADTEMLVCKIWTEFVFGSTPAFIDQAFERQAYDLYLLCDVDLPWEPDRLREHPHSRQELFSMYEQYLKTYKLPYIVVSGQGKARFNMAIKQIARYFEIP